MPGVTTEEDQHELENKKDAEIQIEDITSPQRSILEFFKSPNKPPQKPKDLFGYFSSKSPNDCRENGKPVNGQVNGLKKNVKIDDRSRQEESKDALNSSFNDFNTNNTEKPRKGTKKSLGKKDAASKASNDSHSNNRDCKAQGKNDKKSKPNVKKDAKTSSDEITQENSDEKSAIKEKKDEEKALKKGTKRSLKQDRKSKGEKDKPREPLAASDSGKTSQTDAEVVNGNQQNGKDTGDGNSEMSYTDFLLTLDSKTDTPKPSEKDGTAMDIDENVEKTTEKNGPSIMSFFTKISNSGKKSDIQGSPNTVTTKADIHFEPTPPKTVKESKSTTNKVCLSVDDKSLGEIEVLSSEVFTVDSPAKTKNIKSKQEKSARKSLKLSETIEIADDSFDSGESKETLERKNAFLQSTTKAGSVTKTSQATLSFCKGGLQMACKPSHTTRVRKSEEVLGESPLCKSTPVKRGRGRPPGSFKKSKVEGVKDKKSDEIDGEKTDGMTTQGGRSLRKRYKVDMISIDTKNKTPIRMRLTRCNKSGSSTDESFLPLKPKPSLKQSKAQKLLDKAKKTKGVKSPEEKNQIKKTIIKNRKNKTKKSEVCGDVPEKENTEQTSRRRSSRLSDKFQKSMDESQEDEIMIIDDDEDDTQKKKKKKDLKTPKKDRKPSTPKTPRRTGTPTKGTPKKAAGKLAPIFMKKKMDDKVEEIKKPVLDPEQEKQKRAFLMSGVPDLLKKQVISTSAALVLADLPPFPSIKHVYQASASSGVNVWSLPDVSLNYKEPVKALPEGDYKPSWRKCLLEKEKILCDLSNLKKFTKHATVDEVLIDPLMKEIRRTCPSYNVEKMYKVIREKKQDQDDELSNDIEESKDSKTQKEDPSKDQNDGKKKSKRRSLRLKKKEEVMEVIDLGSPEANREETNKQEIAIVVPWPDKYQSTHSSEIVGNSNSIKKLKSWLMEWKHRVDKEARKIKKQMMKESKSKNKQKEDDWWADDDSDFDLDTDDSEDEEDRLCNTVMLMGPTGVGKTNSVYALAQELGFKVFEVNASSIRNGKRILSQLQEATQSHRVSHSGAGDSGPASLFSLSNKPSPRKKPEKTNMPTSFANFFKKAPSDSDNPKPSKTEEKKKGRKRKRDPDCSDIETTPKKKKGKGNKKDLKFDGLIPTTSNQATMSNQGLNLASTSLILFEDVDVVFEEDKGFWSAIQTFMNSTKIPIILTTNDVTLSSKFEGKYEQLLFKTPSMKQTTVYLQLVCLAEGVRTDCEEITTLVKVLKGDIRRSLLALQFWVDSGGGTVQENKKIVSPPKLMPLPVSEDTCSKGATLVSNVDDNSKSKMGDDDDFVCIKPVKNQRKRRLVSEDESSNSAQFPTSLQVSTKSAESLFSNIHLSCLNGSLGLNLGGSEGILKLMKQMVKGQDHDLVTMVAEACDQYRKLMFNIVYNTYTDILPMPKSKQTSLPSLKTKVKEKKTQLKRIKTFDLYDSEASNDGFLNEPKEESNDDLNVQETKEEKLAGIRTLENFTEFYDNFSFIDSITISSELPDSSNSFILHSKRQLHDTDTISTIDHIDKDNLCSEIEVRALYKLCSKQGHIKEALGDQHVESISIPSVTGNIQGTLVDRAGNSKNLVLKKASNNVMSNLPLMVRCHQRSVVTDYMPVLRDISKAEKLREMSKIKRRFHHYFDNIGLNLKDTTIDVLLTSFQ